MARVSPAGGGEQGALPRERLVPLASLRPAVWPRQEGVDPAHVGLLLEAYEELPAIAVQRGSMRIIDGVHRVEAARLRGEAVIRARVYDDSNIEAVLRSVAANAAHGLPLSLADRKAAAARVLRAHPDWSDRVVGRAVGLSGSTIGRLRRTAAPGEAPGEVVGRVGRLGLDGRVRPISSAVGRRIAARLLTERPNATLREVARAAGISPGTVRDVRDRLRRGLDPLPDSLLATVATPWPAGPAEGREAVEPSVMVRLADFRALLGSLGRDPSIRYREPGRRLLRLLHTQPVTGDEEEVVTALPEHALSTVVRLARQSARAWDRFADLAEEAMRRCAGGSGSPGEERGRGREERQVVAGR
ncbi:hypothetical protein ACTWP5_13145 [Streptomyces sp. 4N509B]|uniref:hypothetical protein n=1 Tax=Streptomyces sp. 4N509B TaxID=3457413 RepID=UPI003FCF31E7